MALGKVSCAIDPQHACRSDLRIATIVRESEFPPTENVKLIVKSTITEKLT